MMKKNENFSLAEYHCNSLEICRFIISCVFCRLCPFPLYNKLTRTHFNRESGGERETLTRSPHPPFHYIFRRYLVRAYIAYTVDNCKANMSINL